MSTPRTSLIPLAPRSLIRIWSRLSLLDDISSAEGAFPFRNWLFRMSDADTFHGEVRLDDPNSEMPLYAYLNGRLNGVLLVAGTCLDCDWLDSQGLSLETLVRKRWTNLYGDWLSLPLFDLQLSAGWSVAVESTWDQSSWTDVGGLDPDLTEFVKLFSCVRSLQALDADLASRARVAAIDYEADATQLLVSMTRILTGDRLTSDDLSILAFALSRSRLEELIEMNGYYHLGRDE